MQIVMDSKDSLKALAVSRVEGEATCPRTGRGQSLNQ
jgi:hypothetical protein